MEYNLKNRPKSPMRYEEFAVESAKWFEGFEKELRDSLTWLTTMWHPRKDVEKAKRQAFIDQLKQILGEEG